MDEWKTDIAEWAKKHDRDPAIVENILIKKGWKPAKYQPTMKSELFHYLNEWYTLSVKTLPTPATKGRRRNPIEVFNLETELASGWTIITESNKQGTKFRTYAFNSQLDVTTPTIFSTSRTKAFIFHDDLAVDLSA